MAFFKRNKSAEENDQPPRNPNSAAAFRALAVGYVLYLCFQMIQIYLQGGPEAPSLLMLVLSVGFLFIGAIVLSIITYREWKRNKARYDAYTAQVKAEAKAAREAEEAREAALKAEDEYYEALEAAEAAAKAEESNQEE